jgi:hypothetical protein
LQFRIRGSRRESAVAQLSTLGHIEIMKSNGDPFFDRGDLLLLRYILEKERKAHPAPDLEQLFKKVILLFEEAFSKGPEQ